MTNEKAGETGKTMSIKELAALIEKPRSTVHRWVAAGELPLAREGGRGFGTGARVNVQDAIRVLDAKAAAAGEEAEALRRAADELRLMVV